jgi:hypothetical protein
LGLIVDPSGLDFIALGTRPIDHIIGTISKGSHYSIAFFKTGCKVKQWFDQTIEGIDTPMAFMAPNGEAVIYPTSMFRTPPYQKFAVKKVASMELLREGGWYARGFNGKQFKTLPVDISIFVHGDSAKFYFPIYEGTDAQVAKKWKDIESFAENYKYAEQTDANGKFNGQFKKWPWSRYENYIIDGLSVTNSNTFIQYLVAQAGLPSETLLPGWNPGNSEPKTSDEYKGYKFASNDSPWKPAPPRRDGSPTEDQKIQILGGQGQVFPFFP